MATRIGKPPSTSAQGKWTSSLRISGQNLTMLSIGCGRGHALARPASEQNCLGTLSGLSKAFLILSSIWRIILWQSTSTAGPFLNLAWLTHSLTMSFLELGVQKLFQKKAELLRQPSIR